MSKKLNLGWREWVGAPDLQIPAIKAKIDTGARTSSLHALDPELTLIKGQKYVSFLLMPVQRSLIEARQVVLPLVDERKVTNSGGIIQERFVVSMNISLGTQIFPIEVTLANRRDMKFRMLLGRKALENCLIDPAQSYLLGKTNEQKAYLAKLRTEMRGQ